LLATYAAEVGDDLRMHEARWGQTLSPTYFDDYIGAVVLPKLQSRAWLIDYLLRLDPSGPPVSPRYVRGDANLDGLVDLADALAVFRYGQGIVSTVTEACFVPDSCDANDDGVIDVSDGIYLIAYRFAGGPAPPEPFPDRGFDPTSDTLDW
ncbi:MAG: hypothetical protein KDC38_18385, partial [Planctomycetes bacterium]|nr:hypothetical protein [Planctomycetota bacterium]